MRAILIRVGADGTRLGGGWRAPVDPDTKRFIYIPIPERASEFRDGLERRFDEVHQPQVAIRHPEKVRNVVSISAAFRALGADGLHPAVS